MDVFDVLDVFLNDKVFMFHLSIIFICMILWVVWELYAKIGFHKTIIIVCGMTVFLLVIHYTKIELVKKYPYEYANDIYYSEAYDYGYDILGSRYKLQYKYGRIIFIVDGPSNIKNVSYKVRLNHKERREFKQIFKKYNILGLIKMDESKESDDKSIDNNEMGFNEYFYFLGHIGEAGFYYKRDNLPINYGEFRKELWEFVFEKINAPEFEREIEDTMSEGN